MIFHFEAPSSGWLPFSFTCGAGTARDDASYALNDPLWALHLTVLGLAERRVDHYEVALWLEPDGYLLSFDVDAEAMVNCQLSFVPGLVPGRPSEHKEAVGAERAPLAAAYRVLMRALDEFDRAHGHLIESDWRCKRLRADYAEVRDRARASWKRGA